MGSVRATSPPSKRVKLESSPSPSIQERSPAPSDTGSLEQEHCSICLQSLVDRTVIPTCAHEFCFECILLWSEQSRKCPLCSRSFDNSYLIHHIRSQYDYQKHYLAPSPSSPQLLPTGESRARALRNTRRERQWGRRERRRREEADQLERAIARRRWVYRHHLYAKHVASNPFTRYRPFPNPAQFAVSPDLISRMTAFLRRELRVWPDLDVEFLTTFTISLMKSIDIRSESAVKLLAEFLDLDVPYIQGGRHVNAEHFAHEIYCYLRSPYRDLNVYDEVVQYDVPQDLSPPHQPEERGSRWVEESPERLRSSRSPRRSRSRSFSRSRSPIFYVDSRSERGRGASVEEHRTRRGQRGQVWSASQDSPEAQHEAGRRGGDHSRSARHMRRDAFGVQQQREHSGKTRLAEPRAEDDRQQGFSDQIALPSPRAASSEARIEDQGNVSLKPVARRGDIKGKRREREESPPSKTPKLSTPPSVDPVGSIPSQEVTTTVEYSSAGEVTDRSRNVAEDGTAPGSHLNNAARAPRAPRHRTLLESVQAHLSRPAIPRRVTEPAQTFVGAAQGPDKNTANSVPTLLARLSGAPSSPPTSLQQLPADRPESPATKHPSTPPTVPSDRGEIDAVHKVPHPMLLGDPSSERGKMKDGQNSFSPLPSTSQPVDHGRPNSMTPSGPICPSHRPIQTIQSSGSNATALLSSDMRTHLLEKLEEERKQSLDNNSKSASSPRLLGATCSLSGPSSPSPCLNNIHDTTDNGSQGPPSSIKDNNNNVASFNDLEAKLRARALLRVRLAVIEGRTVTTGTSSSSSQNDDNNNDDDFGTGNNNNNNDGCNRSNENAISSHHLERALREKLRERLV